MEEALGAFDPLDEGDAMRAFLCLILRRLPKSRGAGFSGARFDWFHQLEAMGAVGGVWRFFSLLKVF